ncbi:unnamed protein product [Prorocentrum cordatum]|uniref:Uncharacterized protein n=1 Tax=Prorocentrum cordatum TaxID=2364126 RepID=A0ABN9S680_9DINO|nr:unnamed protein product [Polarella glacialis]
MAKGAASKPRRAAKVMKTPKQGADATKAHGAVARFIERKLSHILESRIKTLRDAEGQSIATYAEKEMRRRRVHQGRLSGQFLQQLYADFQLEAGTWDDFPPPAEDGVLNEELQDLVMQCHDENKVTRDAKPLCCYLETRGELDEANDHFLLKSSLPGPMLDATNSRNIHVAILGYIARFGLDAKFKAYWDVVASELDNSWKHCFEDAVAEGARMNNFLKSRQGIMKLFLDNRVVDALAKADGEYSQCCEEIRAVMVSNCMTGRAMFRDKWLSCANTLFKEECVRQLRSLEHNDFDADEVAGYTSTLNQRAAELRKLAGKKKKPMSYVFELYCATLDAMEVGGPRGAALFVLKNRMATIAVNNGQLTPLWWERLLLDIGRVEHCPTALQVPDEWIGKLTPARDCAEYMLKDAGTLEGVIKKVTSKTKTLLDVDRNFKCHIQFLTKHVPGLLRAKLDRKVLQAMPNAGTGAKFDETLELLNAARGSELAAALGETACEELSGIYDVVRGVSLGRPPLDKGAKTFSKLAKDVLARASSFCECKFTQSEMRARGKHAAPAVYGAEALQHMFKQLEDKHGGDGATVDAEALRPVKRFKWLLEDGQKVVFSKWLRDALPTVVSAAPKPIADGKVDDKGEEEKKPAVAKAPSGSSSSKGPAGAPSSSSSAAGAEQKKASNAKKQALLQGLFKRAEGPRAKP